MMMTARLKQIVFLALATAFLAGCAKKTNPDGSSATMGADGVNSSDMVNGIPLPGRLGINPDTQVDYRTHSSDTIYFAFDSSIVQNTERGKLQVVANWAMKHPTRILFLAGNADVRGTPEYNRGLGERRAQAVRAYLIGLGVRASNIQTISYGSDRPAVDGDSESAYAQNRRVEIGVVTQ